MNPLKFKMAMDYLTRAKKVNPDLPKVFPASKAPMPPKKESLETMEAINRFVRDNPRQDMAGGGMLVQPGFGGTRQGYRGEEGAKALRLKQLKADYDTFGKKELNKGARTLGFKDYASMSGDKNINFRRKIKNEIKNFGEVLTEEGSRKRSREARIPKEQDIQIKLLQETNKKKFFDPKKFAKDNNISLPELKKQSALLQKNIYNKRMKIAGKEMKYQLKWIPDDPTFSDNALNKLWKSKLIKYDKNKIDEIFYQAFGNPKSNTYNPKKFLAIKKNLNEYRLLREAINAKYPNINFELDHPLSRSSLNKIFNATTDQLTRVNVLEADLNNGFKDSLSLQYEKAVQSNNLNKKKAVEKIARDLKLNIGKISDDATNFKYNVKEFQKLNMRDEIRKSLLNLQNLNQNFQAYAEKNPDLFKTAGVGTKQSFTQVLPSEIKGVENIIGQESKQIAQNLRKLGFKCKFAGSSGGLTRCDDPMSYVDDIKKQEDLLKIQSGKAPKAIQTLNTARKLNAAKSLFTQTLGPGALVFEAVAALPIAYMGYKGGKTPANILADTTYGLLGTTDQRILLDKAIELGYDTSNIKNVQDFYKKADELDYQEGRADEFMIPDDAFMYPRQVKKAEEDLLGVTQKFLDPLGNIIPEKEAGFEQLQKAQEAVLEDQAKLAAERQSKVKGFLQSPITDYVPGLAGGGIAKIAGVDSGPPPVSGPNSQGLQGLMKRVKRI